MKITKYVHSCLLVETPERVAIFDPGVMSAASVPVDELSRLDDIFITHIHPDHCDVDLVKRLVAKFPQARITSNPEVVTELTKQGLQASTEPPEGVTLFESPHESVRPLFEPPAEVGFHYLDQLSHPGDSHSFKETKAILALPMTAPWGYPIRALNLALELKPQHVLPIHDWHWHDEARAQMYGMFEGVLSKQNITFHKLATSQPIEISV